MGVVTIEGIVEKGQIILKSPIFLPDNTQVFVVVPDLHADRPAAVHTPRLANPAEMQDFHLEISEEPADAAL